MPIYWASGSVDLTTSTDPIVTAVRANGYGTMLTVINSTSSSIQISGVYPGKGTDVLQSKKIKIYVYDNGTNGFFAPT